ncbi:MAG: PIN domain-containing protein [Wenzhouxiangellaceae bacterium]
MIGLDTSFLVGLAVREHPVHAACQAIFEAEIVGRPGSFALAPQVLTEFAHVVTDPRRFERPLAMPDALDMCRTWWNASECRQVAPGAEAGNLFLNWMSAHRLGRKRILDTLLAATWYSAGITRIATTNWRDFVIFEVFEVVGLD